MSRLCGDFFSFSAFESIISKTLGAAPDVYARVPSASYSAFCSRGDFREIRRKLQCYLQWLHSFTGCISSSSKSDSGVIEWDGGDVDSVGLDHVAVSIRPLCFS